MTSQASDRYWNRPNPEARVLHCLRHGETQGGDNLNGSTDVDLSEKGWQQLHRATEALKFDALYCSPLKRCLSYARPCAKQKPAPLFVHDALKECHWGILEGLPKNTIFHDYLNIWQPFSTNPLEHVIEGAETFVQVVERTRACVESIFTNSSWNQALILSHGAVLRAILHRFLELPAQSLGRFDLPHACRFSLQIWGTDLNTVRLIAWHSETSFT